MTRNDAVQRGLRGNAYRCIRCGVEYVDDQRDRAPPCQGAGAERDNYPPSTGDAHQRIDSALQCIAQAMGELNQKQPHLAQVRGVLESAREHLMFGRELFDLQAKGVQCLERVALELARASGLLEQVMERDRGDTTVGGTNAAR